MTMREEATSLLPNTGDVLVVTTEERSRTDYDPGYHGHGFRQGEKVVVLQQCIPISHPKTGKPVDHVLARGGDGETWYLTVGEWQEV